MVEMAEREFEKKFVEAEKIVDRNIHVHLIKPISMRYAFSSYSAGAKDSSTTFNFLNKGDLAGAAANMALMVKYKWLRKVRRSMLLHLPHKTAC